MIGLPNLEKNLHRRLTFFMGDMQQGYGYGNYKDALHGWYFKWKGINEYMGWSHRMSNSLHQPALFTLAKLS